jgi:hypothetical protein
MPSDGRPAVGFSISRTFILRSSVPKILGSIPGVTIVRKQKRFRLAGPDDFCEFVVDGKHFLVIEPFGDNSQFVVASEPPEPCAQVAVVRDAFRKHRVLLGLYAG